MQARLQIRSVLLPQSCVGGVNVPSLWPTVTQPRRQVAGPARPSDFAWPQPESEPEPTYERDTK